MHSAFSQKEFVVDRNGDRFCVQVVCDTAMSQTVVIGAQYALAVSFTLRLVGTSLAEVPQRTGIDAPPQDVLSFLVGLDAADAFNVSTLDVQVRRTTFGSFNVGMNVLQ